MKSHGLAIATFDDVQSANRCLEVLKENETGQLVKAKMEIKIETYQGVVRDWQYPIRELWDAMNNKEEIEKMYKKRWNTEGRKMMENETGNIIITFEGNRYEHVRF